MVLNGPALPLRYAADGLKWARHFSLVKLLIASNTAAYWKKRSSRAAADDLWRAYCCLGY
jgi:hypothetical protein